MRQDLSRRSLDREAEAVTASSAVAVGQKTDFAVAEATIGMAAAAMAAARSVRLSGRHCCGGGRPGSVIRRDARMGAAERGGGTKELELGNMRDSS
jgi:hypothetical protein